MNTAAPPPQLSAALPAAPQLPAAMPAPPGWRCENCGNEVTERYCGACGQRLDPPVHSLWHFSQLAAEDLTHADSRLWRTLKALLFKPGFLTREFLCGRRARYLPPVRLYLVLSLAFFLFAAATRTNFTVLQFGEDPASPGHMVYKAGAVPVTPAAAQETPEQRQQRFDGACKDLHYGGPWAAAIQPLLPATCHKVMEDGGRHLTQSFLHNLPRAMFVFLPIIAAFMMLLYWRPRRYYVEHLLLLVHNHAFVFLAVMIAWLAGLPFHDGLPGIIVFALCVYFVWYVFRSMRVAYGQGRVRTSAKLIVLGVFYIALGMIALVVTSVYTAATL
jgi:Protein of unknown function (DUF3667)